MGFLVTMLTNVPPGLPSWRLGGLRLACGFHVIIGMVVVVDEAGGDVVGIIDVVAAVVFRFAE